MLIFQIFMKQIVSAHLRNFMKSEITQSIFKKDVFICTFTVISSAECRIRANSDELRQTFTGVRRMFAGVRRKYHLGEQLANAGEFAQRKRANLLVIAANESTRAKDPKISQTFKIFHISRVLFLLFIVSYLNCRCADMRKLYSRLFRPIICTITVMIQHHCRDAVLPV